ncbi:MAG: 3-deoxy-manno-octulosonate-8-phosphatase KdsC [Gammaproteobacteria bacterium]|nr:3-deoxy-manno-octulosonate-8-phosphatase KdsC [Gammaproteobacteria bacterium]
MKEILERAARIKLVVFDVDGVLTDGSLYLGDDGLEYKAFNAKDGLGMKMLQRSGVKIGIITARNSHVVALRMESLGIEHLYQGQENKLPAFKDLQQKLRLDTEQIAYVGDDVVDLPIMRHVGLAIAVQDAHKLAIEHAHWKTVACGGRGAAREVCELLLEAQGNLSSALERYL